MSRKQDNNTPSPTTTVPSTETGSLYPSGYRGTNPPPGSTATTVPTGGSGQTGTADAGTTWDQEAQDYYYTYGVPKGSEPTGFMAYNRYRDPIRFLGAMDDRTRAKYVDVMYKRGWYGGKKPGDGLTDDDLTVFGDLLAWSNRRGMNWEEAISALEAQPIRESSRPRVQVASTQDLAEVARRVALETIGRTMSDQELAKFIGSYQDAQRAEGYGSSERAPQADTFFKQRIEKAYGKETDVYKHLVAMSNVANLLEKL